MAWPDEHTLDEDEFDRWLTPNQALNMLGPLTVPTKQRAIAERMQTARLRVAASAMVCGTDTLERVIMPRRMWEKWPFLHSDEHDFWSAGQTSRMVGQNLYSVFGTRLDPAGVQVMLKETGQVQREPSSPEPHAAGSSRGRPRHDYWDELWAEIAAQLATGELIALKQSDIENAMLDWAERNGKTLGESTARLRSALLWKALQRKANKSRG